MEKEIILPNYDEKFTNDALSSYKSFEEAIAKAKDEYLALTIAGIDDKEGMKEVTAARKIVSKVRVEIEKTRKALKEPALTYGKAIDAKAKDLTNLVLPIEQHLEGEIKRIEDEKQAIIDAKINERKDTLRGIGMIEESGAFRIGNSIIYQFNIENATDDDFQKLMEVAATEYARVKEEKKREEERIRQEFEFKEKLKAENERLAAELEAMKKQQEKFMGIPDPSTVSESMTKEQLDQLKNTLFPVPTNPPTNTLSENITGTKPIIKKSGNILYSFGFKPGGEWTEFHNANVGFIEFAAGDPASMMKSIFDYGILQWNAGYEQGKTDAAKLAVETDEEFV